MRRAVGYDLSGWRDLAAVAGEGVVEGGIDGAVVRTTPEGRGPRAAAAALVGGAQGAMAPHGLGDGWGAIGAATDADSAPRRVRVRDLMAADAPEDGACLRAALDGMARLRGASVALAIPDDGSMDEAAREWRLAALHAGGARGAMLVWRPVAVALDAVARGAARVGERIGVVSHGAGGLAVQVLEIAEDEGVAAPERRRDGRPLAWDGGLEARRRAAGGTSGEAWARGPVRAALGEPGRAELLRDHRGAWQERPPPAEVPLPPPPDGLAALLADADRILLDTPLAEAIRARMAALSGAEDPGPEAVARGAAEAARRLAAGLPVFFDFLPQIATVVMGAEGPEPFDLIPEGARLRAGAVYRSRRPARLGLAAGAERVEVYLHREGRSRRATVPLPAPVVASMEVEVAVEQMPAAGRARVTLTSPGLPRALVADWEAATPEPGTWAEVVARSAEGAMPSVPGRMVLPADAAAWKGRDGDGGLVALLRQAERAWPPPWAEARAALGVRIDRRRTVDSDGRLPDGLAAETVSAFNRLAAEACAAVDLQLDGAGDGTNDALLFLTWQFRRCPRRYVAEMLGALRAGRGRHPFFRTGANAAGFWQGLGRCATEAEDQRAAFDLLFAVPDGEWTKNHLACAAFLLSRTDTAPRLLASEEVTRVAGLVADRLRRNLREEDFGPRFMYLPFLLVGLLRVRVADPWALMPDRDPAAAGVLEVAERTVAAMRRRHELADRAELLEEACEELRGRGRNPNLLIALAGAAS